MQTAPDARPRALAAAAALVARGARGALVTADAAGAALAIADGPAHWLPAPRIADVRNPIGAGDVLTSGLAAALERGEPLLEAARRGVAAAAASVESPTAGELEPARAAALLAAVVPEPCELTSLSDDWPAARPTMRDVAEQAGVSLKTVSRVINAEAGVATATAERVGEAIAALGFQRNDLAHSLRKGLSSSTLGLVIEDVAQPVLLGGRPGGRGRRARARVPAHHGVGPRGPRARARAGQRAGRPPRGRAPDRSGGP